MSFLSQLPQLVTRRAKRLGRGVGSGSGAKSGRGTTRHQKARTSIPLHFEGGQNKMTKKYPLLRGKARNKSVRPQAYAVNVEQLNIFKKGTVVDVPLLKQRNLVGKDAHIRGAKVLGRGKIEVPVTVAVPVSATARTKIESAGGTVSA